MDKTQHYTTVRQSKILLECGLDPNTADMFFNPQMDVDANVAAGFVETPECYPYSEIQENRQLYLPCWSFGALYELLPNNDEYETLLYKSSNSWISDFRKEPSSDVEGVHIEYPEELHTLTAETPLLAIFEMISWLLKNKYL